MKDNPSLSIEDAKNTSEPENYDHFNYMSMLLDNVSDAIISFDKNKIITFWNKGAELIYGWTKEEATGKDAAALFRSEASELKRNAMLKEVEAKGELQAEAVHYTKLNKRIIIESRVLPIKNLKGDITGYTAVNKDVTVNRQTEEDLKESELKYSALFNNNTMGVAHCKIVVDGSGKPADFRYLQVNNAYTLITGLQKKEVEGRLFTEIFPGANNLSEDYVARYGGVALKQEELEFETYFEVHKRWYLVYAYCPKPGEFTLLFSDITGRKKAEDDLKKSEENFRTLADNISQLAWMADSRGWIFWYNKRWYDYTGTTLEEMQGWGWKKVHHPDHVEKVTDKFKLAVESGERWEDTFPLKGKDGSYRWFLSRALPIKENNGEVKLWFGTNTDITEMKEAEEAKFESEAKLLEAQRLAHMCSFYFDFEKNIFDWTEEFWNIYELDVRKKYLSINEMMSLVYPEDRTYVAETVKNAIDGKQGSLEMEYRILTGKGNLKYVNYRGKLFYNAEGRHIVRFGTIIDVTQSKLYEKELKRTLDELRRSNQELEQFAYVASHDLQEPIRMVSTYTSMLEKQLKDKLDDKSKQYMFFLTDGAKRMHNLINDLLAYSRVSSKSQPNVPVDLKNLMDEVLRDLNLIITESGAEITFNKLPVIKADPSQLRLVFQNLIQNAVRFRGEEKPLIRIKAERKSNEWLFTIRDNGLGIDPEYHDRIFVIFQRLYEKEKYPGTGIGLSICKKIIERYGGRIWVESALGKGSAFYFTLPV